MSIENNTSISMVNQPLNSNNRPRKMGWIYRFFCWCSGANLDVLEQYPTEYNKYFGTGTIVFMTGVFASASASYALSTIFKDGVYLPIALGLMWGFFIFFLDRYLISSMLKSNSKWQEVKIATPRFILALLIAITIARPIELRIFQPEIVQQLRDDKREKLSEIKKGYDEQIAGQNLAFTTEIGGLTNNPEIVALKQERSDLEDDKKESDEKVQEAFRLYDCEKNGTCGTNKRGYGNRAQSREDEYDRIKTAHDNNVSSLWDPRIAQINIELEEIMTQMGTIRGNSSTYHNEQLAELNRKREQDLSLEEKDFAMSLLAQNTALHDLMNKPGVGSMVLLITLLFIVLECSPILAKLFISKGPYDDAIEDIEHDLRNQSRQRRFLSKQENMINKNMIIDMAKSQKEIIKESLRNWREEEMDRVAREREKQKEDEFFNQ